MRYIKYPSGRIDCESDKCGEWHQGGHYIDELLPGDSLITHDGCSCCTGCGKPFDSDTVIMNDIHGKCKIDLATRVASRFGMIDGAHHKQWVIDQMLQAILSEKEYQTWLSQMNSDKDYDPWDPGIAP